MKLNLGCGNCILPGYVNVDKYGNPDLQFDLEIFPWPWPDNSVEEVLLIHVLEHLGQSVDIFIGVMQELYRVCRPGALVKVNVPHPRHDAFMMDPTHVRPITGQVLRMFSQAENRQWQEDGIANTPLGLLHDINFDLIEQQFVLAEPFRAQFMSGQITLEKINEMERTFNNVVEEIRIVIRAIK